MVHLHSSGSPKRQVHTVMFFENAVSESLPTVSGETLIRLWRKPVFALGELAQAGTQGAP